MESLGELLFILFIVYSLFGGLFGRKQQETPPPRRQTPRREREEQLETAGSARTGAPAGGPRPEYTQPGGTTHGQPDPEGSAAEMLPDDLWELLTGERRTTTPAPPSRHAPVPEAWPDEEAFEEEEFASSWDAGYAGSETPEPEPLPRHEEPIIVSLEGPPPPPEIRHTAFHQRLETLPAPRARRKPRLPRGLGTLPELRRAVVLREILGPPKGLE